MAGVSKTIAAVDVATAFRVLYWWRQHCKQISNGRHEIFKKIINLLTVTVLFLFTFFTLILDAPRTTFSLIPAVLLLLSLSILPSFSTCFLFSNPNSCLVLSYCFFFTPSPVPLSSPFVFLFPPQWTLTPSLFTPTLPRMFCSTGRQCTVPFSVQKWIISRWRCAMLLNISSEKSKVTRELALVELSLACLMVTSKFYDGSSKRITILSIKLQWFLNLRYCSMGGET